MMSSPQAPLVSLTSPPAASSHEFDVMPDICLVEWHVSPNPFCLDVVACHGGTSVSILNHPFLRVALIHLVSSQCRLVNQTLFVG